MISNHSDYSFACRRCKYQLCQLCCHKMVLDTYQEKDINNETSQEKKDVVVSKNNDIRWRFDFHCDWKNRRSKIHGIENNRRRIKCDCYRSLCYCFSSISRVGMVCNSGIYKIKLKIDKIENDGYSNILGITTGNFSNVSTNLGKDGKYYWTEGSRNWIGWGAMDKKDDVFLPNGLYCGGRYVGRRKNIFRRSGFKYKSRNGKYLTRLPVCKSGDVVVLIYNSDLGHLSFQLFEKKKNSKSFDNDSNCNEKVSLLDSYICNLPRDLTFYWFFGHSYKQMSITILD